MAFCVSCGKEMDSEWNTCPNCGTSKLGGENVVSAPVYIQQPVPMEIKHDPQDVLIIISYIAALTSVFLIPICFGPLAAILASIASSKGDKRGKNALIIAILCTIIGMVFGAIVGIYTFQG